ncbi:MAG: ribonuclease H-like domain-containing protein [Chthonomonadaceae bacterium]|nr:ribonuclease H-like domain-containing protein [Chthonomonadaceae bacterium]
MLEKTFLHVPGLGAHTEKSLWQQGCVSWSNFLASPEQWSVGGASKGTVESVLRRSEAALAAREHQFFSKSLGTREAWRAWRDFRKGCLYLDIETDGGTDASSITCVGLYDGVAFRCLIKDQDLHLFPDIVSHYNLIVTFFGTGFDIPMLKRAFPNFHCDHLHFDLCHGFKRLGVRGGLKKIEKQMGIERSTETDGLDGRDAITLWRLYQQGNEKALDTLIQYNQEDVVNMERLAAIAYDRLCQQTLSEAGVAHLFEPINSP